MKIAILSNVNIDRIPKELQIDKNNQDHYIPPFNQYAQELIDEKSGLYDYQPDIVIVHIDGSSLFNPQYFNPFSNTDSTELAKKEAESLFVMIEKAARALPKCLFLMNTIILPPDSLLGNLENNSEYSIRRIEQIYNDRIRSLKLVCDSPNLIVCRWDSVVANIGYSNVYDKRYWYLGRIPYSPDGFNALGQLYKDTITSFLGKGKKVIVLDLDNTLWGGVIGEDGMDGILLGEQGLGKAYRDFQRLLKSIKSKGVLLAVASKNNEQDALDVFRKHPMSVLKADDFVAMKINWNLKSANIRELAEELNLGLNSFVFIDDNPVERMQVKDAIPEVEAPDFPKDPAHLPDWFICLNNKLFDKFSLTSEDSKRTDLYKMEVQRKEVKEKSESIDDFLKNLQMSAVIGVDTTVLIPRLSQLTQRTNQFNLTTKRYSEGDIARFMQDNQSIVYDLELSDRFGSNGVVGEIIAILKEDKAIFDTFLLSCRIIGRKAEIGFVGYILRDLQKRGINKVLGIYIPSAKNMLTKGIFEKLGFVLVEKKDDGEEIWEYSLETLPEMPELITIKERNEGT